MHGAPNPAHYHCPIKACPANPEHKFRECRACRYVVYGVACCHSRWRDEFYEAMQPYEAMARFLRKPMKSNTIRPTIQPTNSVYHI